MNPPRPPLRRRQAFTLIEVVGVLAVVALLAWTASEAVFLRAKDTLRRDEAGRLAQLADALRRQAVAERSFPAETNWASFAATALAVTPAEALRSRAGWDRRLIYDPSFRLGSPPALLPFRQTASGSPISTNARAILLSSVATALPGLGSVTFADLWDRAADRFPAHWPSTWSGRPEDVLVERISFFPEFRRVCLNNLDLDRTATFAVAVTNDALSVAPGGRVETAFLLDSPLLLLGLEGTLQEALPVREELSYVFEAGRWRRGLASGPAHSQAGLSGQLDRFTHLAGTPWGGRPADVSVALADLLAGYAAWAEDSFSRNSSVAGRPPPAFRRLSSARLSLESATGLLLGNPANP